MFVIYDKNAQKVPIKVWLPGADLELKCRDQAMNLANLPFAYKHIALMPDTHMGYGMPIGGILAADGAVIPYAVGMDIGCGMCYCQTNIRYSDIKDATTKDNQSIIQAILANAQRNIPTGRNHNKTPTSWHGFIVDPYICPICDEQMNSARYQLCSLGGGNHFIDLQVDDEGCLAIMIHSGSRNLGAQVCKHYHALAKEMNSKWHSVVNPSTQLSFFPESSKEGVSYLSEMNFCLKFAKQNRHLMMQKVKNIVFNMVEKYVGITGVEITQEFDIHHNYATKENHFGKNVIVHRKGATLARNGTLGIIPGSMGTNSYIVWGLGNDDSFDSCSHGAGRSLGRNQAKEKYTTEQVIKDMRDRGIILVKANKDDVAEECPWAYKDIEAVMENQKDLVQIQRTLRPVGVLIA